MKIGDSVKFSHKVHAITSDRVQASYGEVWKDDEGRSTWRRRILYRKGIEESVGIYLGYSYLYTGFYDSGAGWDDVEESDPSLSSRTGHRVAVVQRLTAQPGRYTKPIYVAYDDMESIP